MENGEEKYLRLNEKEMLEDVDKIRRENGWKPRKKDVPTPTSSSASTTPSSTPAAVSSSEQMTPEQKILARLQAEMMIREQAAQRQEELRLQKEALK